MNKELKIAIVGAGSSYTPELIEGLSEHRETLPVKEIVLLDINEERLSIMEGFVKRYIKHLNYDVKVWSTTSREEAFTGQILFLHKFVSVVIKQESLMKKFH